MNRIIGGKMTEAEKKQKRKETNRRYYLKRIGQSETIELEPEEIEEVEEVEEDEPEEDEEELEKDILEKMLQTLKYFSKKDLQEIIKNISDVNPSLNIKYKGLGKDLLINLIISYKIDN